MGFMARSNLIQCRSLGLSMCFKDPYITIINGNAGTVQENVSM
jgi:hypothetical protein